MSPRPAYPVEAARRARRAAYRFSAADAKALFRSVTADATRVAPGRGVDKALLILGMLLDVRARLDEQIEVVMGWARARRVPRSAIADTLGRASAGNLETVYPRHRDVAEWIMAVKAGEISDRDYFVGETKLHRAYVLRPDDEFDNF